MEKQKEKRTEIVSMWLTPETAKEFKLASDNEKLQDEIIKRYIHREGEWLEDELKEMDEYTIRYRAKLLGIRDAFSKAQDSYSVEIEAIYNKAAATFKQIDRLTSGLEAQVKQAYGSVAQIQKAMEYINVDRLERLMNVVKDFNSMPADEKRLIELLIGKS